MGKESQRITKKARHRSESKKIQEWFSYTKVQTTNKISGMEQQ